MKECPKCGTPHEKPGTFCSRACANSRQWTTEHKKVFSEKQKAYMASDLSEEHRAKRQLQLNLLHAAGIMKHGKRNEDWEDYLTNPDDYFLIPFNDMDLKLDDGDIWEEIDDIKY